MFKGSEKVTIVTNLILTTHPSHHPSSVRLTPERKTTINCTVECTVTLDSSNLKYREENKASDIYISFGLLEITEPLEKGTN